MAVRRDALAARREALGHTQESLAQELGVELSTVGRWERGTLTPQPWRRPDLAKSLKLSLAELDVLLNPSADQVVSESLASRREVIVDAALLTGAVLVDRVVATWGDRTSPERFTVPAGISTAAGASKLVAKVHRSYQAARYGEAAGLLPSVTDAIDAFVADSPAGSRRVALQLQTSVSIAAAKLATKAGDALAGRSAAEQAQCSSEEAEDPFGQAAAAYQRTCALLRAGRLEDRERAEELAVTASEALRGTDPNSLTWRGALTLISAIIAARRDDPHETARRLDHAEDLARRLGADGNIGWTAFGPTNVMIHRVSAAVALDDPREALTTAERIDVTAMPAGLHGRQAQFHLDSAWAHNSLGEDPLAVIHLLDTERVAPELVRANPNARGLIHDLLKRERRRAVPGLRGLALRAGVAA